MKLSCGKRRVNKRYRVPLTDICKAHNIKEGQYINVWIEIIEDGKENN